MKLVLIKPFDVFLPPIEDDALYPHKSWSYLRDALAQRDAWTCQVCGLYTAEKFQLSHIIDRMCGGKDIPSNLVVGCHMCNNYKPPHRTRAEYEDWVRNGFWVKEFMEEMFNRGYPLPSIAAAFPAQMEHFQIEE